MNVVNQGIIKHKMGLLNLAEELQNVSQACRVMGVSRDTFYRVKEAKETGGLEALLHKDRRRPNFRNRVEPATEEAILAFAMENPAAGQVRVSNELRKRGIVVSATGVDAWIETYADGDVRRWQSDLSGKVAELYLTKINRRTG